MLSTIRAGSMPLTVREIYDEMKADKIKVNRSYQRSDVWKLAQKQALIDSIIGYYPIGVLVLWENKDGQKEILDGQQRANTIVKFLDDDIRTAEGKKFIELGLGTRTQIEAYPVPYLELNQHLSEDEVSNIFIRLQEGTPLNTPEKVYAFRGNFRDAWFDSYVRNKEIFIDKLSEKKFRRFKDRFLIAQFLRLEMQCNFRNKIFPSLTYPDFKSMNDEFKTKTIPNKIIERLNHNIRFLGIFLHNRLGAFDVRDLIAVYTLQSFFKQSKIIQEGDAIVFRNFVMGFMHDLRKVKLYKDRPPRGMDPRLYGRLYKYKQFGRQATSTESVEIRFDILLKEYKRRVGNIAIKDRKRFYETEQKVDLFFKQKGICPQCRNELDYGSVTADHKKMHSKGGKTVLYNGRLLHKQCHEDIHKSKVIK